MSTQTSRRFSPVRALRAASPALWPARLRLSALKASYKAGTYSGHPEEMLDDIDGVEDRIRRYKDGIRSVKPVPAPVIMLTPEPAPDQPVRSGTEKHVFDELTARCHIDGGPFEPGVDAAHRRLAYMEDLYLRGGFMGHPEELLEDIEDERCRVDRLTAEAAGIV
jgi:hypothetical protein